MVSTTGRVHSGPFPGHCRCCGPSAPTIPDGSPADPINRDTAHWKHHGLPTFDPPACLAFSVVGHLPTSVQALSLSKAGVPATGGRGSGDPSRANSGGNAALTRQPCDDFAVVDAPACLLAFFFAGQIPPWAQKAPAGVSHDVTAPTGPGEPCRSHEEATVFRRGTDEWGCSTTSSSTTSTCRRTACNRFVPDLADRLVIGNEGGDPALNLSPLHQGRQMARRQAVHRQGRPRAPSTMLDRQVERQVPGQSPANRGTGNLDQVHGQWRPRSHLPP